MILIVKATVIKEKRLKLGTISDMTISGKHPLEENPSPLCFNVHIGDSETLWSFESPRKI